MDQITFSEAEYQNKKRKTRRELFLERMDNLIPWKRLEKKVARYYPKGQTGRPPYPLPTMLRVHFMQLFYNLSDPAMEDALYEIESMRHFAGLKLDRLPDETTILKFRHFLERHGLGEALFKEVNKHLEQQGLMLREGSIVDATIISAPSSTKNESGQRDPDMRQTKKGNAWHFGMKMHIGVDDKLGLIHSIDTTAANVHDIVPADKLLHGEEQRVFGDAGYLGIQKRNEHKHRNSVSWYIAKRPGTRKQLDAHQQKVEKIKASIRAKVEHPFRYIKQVFGYSKVRYRGLAKNTHRLYLLAAFSNLLIGDKYQLA
ncbi:MULTISPECIES: IS5 family transposase [unclassified Halomonas]|mgnify:CR=1 FL=1|jgi:IS5 family transposase|uniref:IS5 family transposase n=1 Tax=unclassified Halomonas TaxID=2609666 RepID=UPI002097D47D|nr:IS5 family transposase [Halomonas sp. Mc5H-6]MCO7248235.1 IS5 family transposase [Halomonas sp. Mc5H-6]